MTKIFLIRPPSTYFGKSARVAQMISVGLPLGILYMAAVLEKNGHEVKVYDSLIENPSLRKIAEGLYHFGSSWNDIKKEIETEKPSIVGIANQFTEQMKNAIKIAEIAKSVNKSILTVVGGNHSTVAPEEFLGHIDVACRGEGEYAMLDLADGKSLSRIDGISYHYKGKIKTNKPRKWIMNLDELPFPAYHLIDMERYFDAVKKGMETRPDQFAMSERQISLITSRGCPYNCLFCSIRLNMGQVWRANSADYVLRHLEYVARKYGVRHIHFEDDNLTFNPKRFEAILDGMKERNINITFDTPNGTRLDTFNKRLLRKMKNRGLTQLKIAIESGYQPTIDNIIRKKLKLEDGIKVAKWCKELRIPLSSFYVIGFPGETKETIEKSLDFQLKMFKEYDVIPHCGIALPYIGTDLYKLCKENGYMIEKPFTNKTEFDVFGQAIIRTPDFEPEDIKNYLHSFYRKILFLQISKSLSHPISTLNSFKLIFINRKTVMRIMKAGIGYIS